MSRAGIVTVVGKPNVGKSTLLNRVVGQKLSIVSPKPQSTRDRIVGIRTVGDVQMVVLDTPGLLNPRYALQAAMTGEGVDALLDDAASRLPESPFLYPDDEISTQTLRFFAAELVRETALEQLEDEVPYSVACVVEEFREDRSPMYIRAVIYVERESQKRILIGHKGAQIREIGRVARQKIEELVGAPVYLDLWVKVLANWRRDVRSLKRFGYKVPEEYTR